MSGFNFIDDILSLLINKLHAKLIKDRPKHFEAMRTFEEGRIARSDKQASEVIVIQPNFEAAGVNSSFLNFINICRHVDAYSAERLNG